jgi:hypothetical protein
MGRTIIRAALAVDGRFADRVRECIDRRRDIAALRRIL